MRSYANDPARAAARVIALAMLADGAPDRAEIDLIQRRGAAARLGVDAKLFDEVMQALCEDLAQSVAWFDGVRSEFSDELIDALIDEAGDKPHELLGVLLRLVAADGRISEGEERLLLRAQRKWARAMSWPVRLRPRADNTRPGALFSCAQTG
ncbi:TerB family tellurite resistance protein [Pseudothauera hydrothermalis]|uniref:TerB family tellurite resistance protein n=1 Tax=Pseudothauera hydrothermalis TaxID=2184083 RepID=UPI0013C2C29B|nr:TerB family tellurite resistance protein [Pseudothauera hydrothermalis]